MRGYLFAILVVLFCSTLPAQLTTGQIAGMVTDSQGLGVPAARVHIRHASTGESFDLRSNESGAYLARALPLGDYSITVEANGFKSVTRSGIQLTANQVARVDFTLEVGTVSDTVTVSADVSP